MSEELIHQPKAIAKRLPPEALAQGPFYMEPIFGGREPSSEGVIDYLSLIRHRIGFIFLLTILGAALLLGLALWQVPLYESRTSIEIQTVPDSNGRLSLGDSDAGSGPSFTPESYIQTQARVLQSKSMRQAVEKKLLETKQDWNTNPPRTLQHWCGSVGLNCAALLPQGSPSLPEADYKVKVLDNTRIIEITADSSDPAFAADYANTLVGVYIDEHLSTRWAAAQRTREWLTRQLEDLKGKLQASENKLRNYERTSGIVLTPDKREVGQTQLMQLQDELTKAQAERISKQSLYEVANAVPLESIPEVIDNERLSTYQLKLTDLKRELAELSSQLTPEHYKVKRVQAQIQELQSTLQRERGSILGRIRNEYKASAERESLLLNAYRTQRVSVTKMSQSLVEHEIIQREVDSLRGLYDELVRKVNENTIVSAARVSSIRILDRAEPAKAPFKPLPVRLSLMGAIIGLTLGVGLVVGKDVLNRTLKSPGDVPYHLGLPELALIPDRTSTKDTPRRAGGDLGKGFQLLGVANGSGKESKNNLALATWFDRESVLAESFRGAVASILGNGNGQRPQVIMMTSPARGDGKSTVIANLGVALAEILPHVLIIDADLRNPRLPKIFNVANTWGLSNLLLENGGFDATPSISLARRTQVPGLWLLPPGPANANISSLLYSEQLPKLLKRLRSEFDVILIDTPPLLHLADARVLGRWADAAILVIRAGKTRPQEALFAKQLLMDGGGRVLGTILNRWDVRSATRYGYSYSDYMHQE